MVTCCSLRDEKDDGIKGFPENPHFNLNPLTLEVHFDADQVGAETSSFFRQKKVGSMIFLCCFGAWWLL